jgi:CO dehydrogenase/acetyl-CoA synthase beta subunit
MGWDNYIVPYGRDTITGIYPLHWAIRGALTFGGHKKGEALKCLQYCKERVFAFGLALGEVDDIKYATGAGAINMGFPVIADTDIPEIRPTGICTYEHLVKERDYKKIVPVCIEVRGVKVKVSEIPIPVAYSAAFEGERVRREQMYMQFGGKYSEAFEYVRMSKLDRIEDNKIEIIGPEIDDVKEGGAIPLGILVEVAGRKMQKDFEPILERQIHSFLNEAMGVFHMGQRDMCWIRISKDAKKKGFKIKHFGVILHARLHDTFGAIVDKAHEARDARTAGMTDESVDTFYSCTLCQSFAPNHLCMVKPERLGLCGAYSYLDAKASNELNPTGPNQPVKKGECLDPVKGEWKGVNEFIYQSSNKTLDKFHGYSIMSSPETSCCVAGTEVLIDDKIVKMGEFINKHQGGEEYAKSSVLTLMNGKTVPDKIVAMQKFPAPEQLVKMTTKSGVDIILTGDHKVAIDKPEGLRWVEAGQVAEGDRAFSLAETDYLLDIVTGVEKIQNKGKYRYVYNLTTADEHCYFANGLLIKNCGCFECIVAILPEANGFMIVHREYSGMTPCGMSFSTLAGSVGGGAQTPGFMGVGRLYLVSKKFISADGGLKRIVWMPKELKEHLGDKLKKRCEEEGGPELLGKIADESVATTSEELLKHLEKVGHPALKMPPLM